MKSTAAIPKILRRVGGYNLDEFIDPAKPVNLAKMMVGSEGTLGVVLEAKLSLVPLPKAKAVMVIEFADLLEALAAAPVILRHKPSAVEVMDKSILDNTRQNAALDRIRKHVHRGRSGARRCASSSTRDRKEDLPPRLRALEARSARAQARLSLSLRDRSRRAGAHLEPARSRAGPFDGDEGRRQVDLVRRRHGGRAGETAASTSAGFWRSSAAHGTTAGVYAHASVGCLHVRPVINMKTEEGVRQVRSHRARTWRTWCSNSAARFRASTATAWCAARSCGRCSAPRSTRRSARSSGPSIRTGIFNPGKIVDAPPLTSNLRFGAGYQTPNPTTWFDYSEYGGMGGAVEMCSGVGACRKKLAGTMCPSYMATREETDSTRGRANVLRLAMTGRLGEAGLGDRRRVRGARPVPGMPRLQSRVPGGRRHGALQERISGRLLDAPRHAAARARAGQHRIELSVWGSRVRSAVELGRASAGRWLNEKLLGIDPRRTLPAWKRADVRAMGCARHPEQRRRHSAVTLFNDTFTNHYDPEIGIAARGGSGARRMPGERRAARLLRTSADLARPARRGARASGEGGGRLVSHRRARREDSVLRAELSFRREGRRAVAAARRAAAEGPHGRRRLHAVRRIRRAARSAAARRPEARFCCTATVIRSRWDCCGDRCRCWRAFPAQRWSIWTRAAAAWRARSAISSDHYDVSVAIANRKLLPAVKAMKPGDVLVAPGTSCRHQVADLGGGHRSPSGGSDSQSYFVTAIGLQASVSSKQ